MASNYDEFDSNEFDINISNISKQYGSCRTTFERLTLTINTAFECHGLINEFGPIHNIRIPYSQDGAPASTYFGFLTMKNIATHDELLGKLQQLDIKFAHRILEFKRSSCHRPSKKVVNCAYSDLQPNWYVDRRGNLQVNDRDSRHSSPPQSHSPRSSPLYPRWDSFSTGQTPISNKRKRCDKEVTTPEYNFTKEFVTTAQKSTLQTIHQKLTAMQTKEASLEREYQDMRREQQKVFSQQLEELKLEREAFKKTKDRFLKEKWVVEAKEIELEKGKLDRQRITLDKQYELQKQNIDSDEENWAIRRDLVAKKLKEAIENEHM
jgi:hypothetical protein